MKLCYLTPLTFPSHHANRLQVMKMSAAFEKQADFVLYIAESRVSHEKLFEEYNIRNPVDIQEVGKSIIPPRRFWQARKFLPILVAESEDVIWYTRDVLLTDWLISLSPSFKNNYFFELHTLARFSSARYRRVLQGARGIITTNEEKKKDCMERFGILAEKICVAPNSVDMEEFNLLKDRKLQMRKELGIGEHVPLVVYAGTDAEAYGTHVLREAKKLLRNNAEILIISGRARNEALQYMAAADVLVAPYLAANDHFIKYMSPMKIREYMAMERPIVVSNLPSIRAYIPTDDYAFFTSAGDYVSLAREINKALENKEEAARRAKNAYDLVLHFSWDARADAIINFISTLI